MNCVFYGNCQIALSLYEKARHILTDYKSYSYVNNDRLDGLNIIELKEIDLNVLNNCSLFIYQPLNSKHGVYSTDHIMQFLPENCVKISIPYIYNSSFYTLYWESASPRWRIGTFYNCGWKNIILMIKSGFNLDEILKMYDNKSLDFYFEERMNICLDSLREKEFDCTIKVTDFILNNARENRLFFTQNHLSNYFITYITNQILKHLNIDRLLDYDENIETFTEQGCVLDKYNKFQFNYDFAYSDEATKQKIIDFYNYFINIKDEVSEKEIKPYTIKKEQPEKFIDHDL